MKLLAARSIVKNQVTGNVPEELVSYLSNVVDLTTVTTEPAQLQKSLAALWDDITNTNDDEFDADLRAKLKERATALVARANHVLGLMSSAREAVDLEPDATWRDYFVRQCATATDVLTAVRDEATMIENDMGDYPDDSTYEH